MHDDNINLRDRQKLKTQLHKMVEKYGGKRRWKPDGRPINIIAIGKVVQDRKGEPRIPETLGTAVSWSQLMLVCLKP